MKYFKIFFFVFVLLLSFSSCTPPETRKIEMNENIDIVDEKLEVLSPEDITVGFVFVGPINDGGYSESHDRARLKLERELKVKTVYRELVPENYSVKKAVKAMIDEGANIIFLTSKGYEDYVLDLADEYKDVKFFQCGSTIVGENISSYFAKIYQAMYLAGIVAGSKTKTGKIGYVASKAVPEVIRGINAFTLGVKSVNKEAVVELAWTDAWYDLEKESAAAQTLIDSGADVITMHQHTDEVVQVAKRNRVNAIGYNTDMSDISADFVLSSVYCDWSVYYIDQVEKILSKSYEPSFWWGDISTGVFDLAPLNEKVSKDTASKIEQLREGMVRRRTAVFTGPIYDNKGELILNQGEEFMEDELLGMSFFVDGVESISE